MSLLLGIDLGTSYFKIGLFDERGNLQGLGRVALAVESTAPGRQELPVAKFWERLQRGLKTALAEARATPAEIAGISYASQANTCLLLDDADRPLTPFVLWTDTRGEPVAEHQASFARSEAFRRTVGFDGITGNWAVAKWADWQRNQPDVAKRARRLMTISDYLAFALTEERVGDGSTAAFLGLLDLRRGDWWPEAQRVFGLESGRLSRPLPPGTTGGRTGKRARELLGLPEQIPVAVGGLDHHVAALGAGVGRWAEMSLSTGTVLAALALVRDPQPRPGCYHGPHFEPGWFYRLAFEGNGAGQLEDYQRSRAPQRTIPELLAQAEGTTGEHGVAVRQLLERIAVAQRELVRQVAEPGWPKKIVATGGGARSPLWLQIKADAIGATITTSACEERACLGAAMLAGVAANKFRDLTEAAAAMVREGRRYEPRAR